ncbi:MAG: hypothetical protein KKC37_04725 [Proteobacteria bacterium]|nr:hypothetical protein [Pseudomonadota bacterium]
MTRSSVAWWKVVAITLVATAVSLIFHAIGPRLKYDFPPSFFVRQGLFVPAASILLAVTFGALAAVFVLIQADMTGTRLRKGLRFGLLFAGLWLVAMVEMSLIFGSPLAHELYTGAADGLGIVILGILLGRFAATDSRPAAAKLPERGLVMILVTALFFVCGRYFAYAVLGLQSVYATKPLSTLAWTIGVGLCIGVMSWLLVPGPKADSTVKRALWFGGLVFGIVWTLGTIFIVVFLDISLGAVILRAAVDALSVTVGVWAAQVAAATIRRSRVDGS